MGKSFGNGMNKTTWITLLITSMVCSSQVFAEEGRASIGVGTKQLSIVTSNIFTTSTYVWSGAALIGGYDFTDYISLYSHVYVMTEDVDADSTMNGFDAAVRFGSNRLGFTYYGSLGFYSDTWKHSAVNLTENYRGVSVGAGFGYNWKNLNVNWDTISFRSTYDYQGNSTAGYVVATGSMSLAYRF